MKFGADDRGSVALFIALLLTTVLVGVGMAVDLARVLSTQSKMQLALDAAVVNGASAPRDLQEKAALSALKTNLAQLKIEPTAVNWSRHGSGAFTGAVSAIIPTTFMRIASRTSMDLSATSTAVKSELPAQVLFTLDDARGWAWKQVTLWTHSPGNAADTLVATFTYQPRTQSGLGSGTVDGPLGQPLHIGADYDYAYLRMDVSFDGCGPGFVPKDPYAIDALECVAIANTGARKATPVLTFRTNDPATAYRMFIDGKPLTTATVISNILSCDRSIKVAWEDADNPDPTTPQWALQDIFFTVNTTTCGQNTNVASVIKLVR